MTIKEKNLHVLDFSVKCFPLGELVLKTKANFKWIEMRELFARTEGVSKTVLCNMEEVEAWKTHIKSTH